MDLLKHLQKLKIDLDILTNTRIGMTVNELRKCTKDDEVIALSKVLIKDWKKFLPKKSEIKDSPSSSSSTTKIKENAKDDKHKDSKNHKDKAQSQTVFPPHRYLMTILHIYINKLLTKKLL